MREANYFDLLSSHHFIILFCFLAAFVFEIYIIVIAFRKLKKLFRFITICILLATIVYALMIKMTSFPGGGRYDASYELDRFQILSIQERLNNYKSNCNAFPTTEQGLIALATKPSDVDCPNYDPQRKIYFSNVKYVSNGHTYEIETTREYGIKNLVVKGTSEFGARYFIREP